MTTTALAIPAGAGLARLALKLDAAVSAANGVAYLAIAGPLADLLGLPAGFLRGLGAFLVVYAAAVWLVGARPRLNRTAVLAVILGNAVWTVDSLALVVFGWHDPTTVGTIWVVMQAVVVAAFAVLQLEGRRRLA
jgi:hypothetical protein